MTRFSPKIEIINHFDNLINRIDIDIDNCLEKYNDEKALGELLKSSENNRKNFRKEHVVFNIEFFDDSSNHHFQPLNLWTESTKVTDYLKQVRMKTIDELKKAQNETLENYNLDSWRIKSDLCDVKNIDQFRSLLFAESFYFQIHFTQSDKRYWPFNTFTFVTDFNISPSHIDSLEKLINDEINPLGRDCVIDDEMVLIGLLFKRFIDNLSNFPNHVIRVCKREVSNIKFINFNHEYSEVYLTSSSTIDLSNLDTFYLSNGDSEYQRESVKINLEGLFSLKKVHLVANSEEIYFSLRNLNSLETLSLYISCPIDENIIRQLFDSVPHIERLFLCGTFSHFNLDCFLNLKLLSFKGSINESFNFELFKNLCNQLTILNIELTNIEEKTLLKLLDGYNFPYLSSFSVIKCNLKDLKKEFFNRFPILNRLYLVDCNIEVIQQDLFSNLKHLNWLFLCKNRLKSIEENTFLDLKNLETLDLSGNELASDLDTKFIGVGDSVYFILEDKSAATLKRFWYRQS